MHSVQKVYSSGSDILVQTVEIIAYLATKWRTYGVTIRLSFVSLE